MSDIANQIKAGSDGPGIGHNSGLPVSGHGLGNGAELTATADPAAAHRKRAADLIDAANLWLKSVKSITDGETASRCTDFINQVRKERDALGTARKAAGKPHRDAIDAINGQFDALIEPLVVALGMLQPLQTAWLQRLRQEQAALALKAAQDAAEAKAAADAAAAKPVETVQDAMAATAAAKRAAETDAAATAAFGAKAHVTGDFSARASGLRSSWKARITDYPKALAYFANDAVIRDAVQQLADRAARGQRAVAMDVPGCEGVETEKAV